MRPVLFHVLGFPISGYGLSKALAATAGAWLLARAFARLGWDRELATPMVLRATLIGFAGAKLYYLAEHAGTFTLGDLGGSGFTWFGGFLAGTAVFVLDARRKGLPLAELAGASAVPLSIAYGIGRIGCLLAGDGTYGKPSGLPWAVAFPHGTVPTTSLVHPTPAYEALGAFAIAAVLWAVRNLLRPAALFGLYAVLSGTARVLVETVRVNRPLVLGLTQPQLWSALLILTGVVLLARAQRRDTSAVAPA